MHLVWKCKNPVRIENCSHFIAYSGSTTYSFCISYLTFSSKSTSTILMQYSNVTPNSYIYFTGVIITTPVLVD